LAVISEVVSGDAELHFDDVASLALTVVSDGDVYDLAVAYDGRMATAFPNFAIRLSRSDDLGDTWGGPITVGSGVGQSGPALAFRNLVEETVGMEDGTETTTAVEAPYLFLAYVKDSRIMLARAGFPDGLLQSAVVDEPVEFATGNSHRDLAASMIPFPMLVRHAPNPRSGAGGAEPCLA
jgi:hypothetical protein